MGHLQLKAKIGFEWANRATGGGRGARLTQEFGRLGAATYVSGR